MFNAIRNILNKAKTHETVHITYIAPGAGERTVSGRITNLTMGFEDDHFTVYLEAHRGSGHTEPVALHTSHVLAAY